MLKLPPITELKSVSKATDLRNAGNKQFSRKNYTSAVNLYTQSVASSPVPPGGADVETSNVLALAFANRSAAAFHISDYKACLADIELAFMYGYPESRTYKLFDRRAKCYSALLQPDTAMESIQEGMRRLDVADLDPKQTATWKDDFNAQLHNCASMNGNPACNDVKGVSSDGVCRSMPAISVDKMNTTFTSLTDNGVARIFFWGGPPGTFSSPLREPSAFSGGVVAEIFRDLNYRIGFSGGGGGGSSRNFSR